MYDDTRTDTTDRTEPHIRFESIFLLVLKVSYMRAHMIMTLMFCTVQSPLHSLYGLYSLASL